MLLPRFSYHQPASVAEALEVLGQHGDQAAIIAGGTDLLVNMKHGKLAPRHLVGLEGIDGLEEIGADNGSLVVGPRLTASALAASGELSGAAQALALGAASLGSPQVRNRATVGGNVCTARPAADMCVPLLVLGAKALLAGPDGPRELPLDEFFLGPGQTAKKPGELLTGLSLPRPAEGSGAGYEKLGLRKALEIALVNVAAAIWLEPDGKTIKQAKVALGAVAPVPMLSPGAEAALTGQTAGEEAFAQAAEAAATDAKPISDHRGSAQYRREVVQVLTRRALGQAWQAALGQ
ncbi:MAG: xanthine dehydrogenase family protein subunit M [Desulfarculaceae bacterium]|nr:xanthine dehydrogenase family protein subunit M [Desulfarculaceae bacterium]MCF8072040.1 xanthine dehydrogenase family protein subunit M [Desulfarculaceae bacterium]MCF8101557.1 xanthine dehydrogenase family protein subunit M [Desulfarculaceae bacterium]MCF8115107.1 xanthine dehydrogenase family protein subunit M [Desulfarculaceae bacterium]